MECFKCKEKFTINLDDLGLSTIPIILECRHEICRRCILKIENKTLICTVCNKKYNTDTFQIVPNTYSIGDLFIEKYNKHLNIKPLFEASVKEKLACEECKRCNAVLNCGQCNALFCYACFSSVHDGSSVLRKHVKTDLSVENIDVENPAYVQKLALCFNLDEILNILEAQNGTFGNLLEETKLISENGCHNENEVIDEGIHTRFMRLHSLLLLMEQNVVTLSKRVNPFPDKDVKILYCSWKQYKKDDAFGNSILQDVINKITNKQNDFQIAPSTVRSTYFEKIHDAEKIEVSSVTSYTSESTNNTDEKLDTANDTNFPERRSKSDMKNNDFPGRKSRPKDMRNDNWIANNTLKTRRKSENRTDYRENNQNVSSRNRFNPQRTHRKEQSLSQHSSFRHSEGMHNNRHFAGEFNIYPNNYFKNHPGYQIYEPSASSLENYRVRPIQLQNQKQRMWGATSAISKGNKQCVVTHIVSPSEFYITYCDDENQLMLINEALVSFADHNGILPEDKLSKGYLLKVKFDKGVMRASVLSFTKEKVIVRLIDTGATATVSVDNCYYVPYQLLHVPALAHCCFLEDFPVPEEKYTEEIIEEFKQLIYGKGSNYSEFSVRKVNKSQEKFGVNLYFSDNTLVSDALKAILYGQCISPAKWTRQEIPPNELIVNRLYEVRIMHVNTPWDFFVVKCDDRWKELSQQVNTTYLKTKANMYVYAPYIGMPIAVLYKNSWFRAEIVDIGDGKLKERKFKVFLVDVGCEAIVSWNDIRKLIDLLVKSNRYAFQCKLYGISPIDDKCSDRGYRLLETFMKPRTNLKIKVRGMTEENIYEVVMYYIGAQKDVCINMLLVKNDLALEILACNLGELEYYKYLNNDAKPNENKTVPNKMSNKPVQNKIEEDEIMVIDPEHPDRIPVKIKKCVSPAAIEVEYLHFEKLGSCLNNYFNSGHGKLLVTEPDTSKLYAVQVADDESWYRAKIINVSDDSVTVHLVDKKERKSVNKQKIYHLDERYANIIVGSKLLCSLSGIKPPGGTTVWPQITKEHLQEKLEKYTEFYITEITGTENIFSTPVILWATYAAGSALEPMTTEWINLNDFLLQEGLALPERRKEIKIDKEESKPAEAVQPPPRSPSLEESVSDNEYYPVPEFPTAASTDKNNTWLDRLSKQYVVFKDQEYFMKLWLPAPHQLRKSEFDALVTNIDGNFNLYFRYNEDERKLEEINQCLQAKYENSQSEFFDQYYFPFQACVAKFNDGQWYRALVEEMMVEESKAAVIFVDYGNRETCPLTYLRKNICKQDIPVLCHRVNIDKVVPVTDNNVWPDELYEYIEEKVLWKICRFICSKRSDGSYQVESIFPGGSSRDIFIDLVNMNLARFKV